MSIFYLFWKPDWLQTVHDYWYYDYVWVSINEVVGNCLADNLLPIQCLHAQAVILLYASARGTAVVVHVSLCPRVRRLHCSTELKESFNITIVLHHRQSNLQILIAFVVLPLPQLSEGSLGKKKIVCDPCLHCWNIECFWKPFALWVYWSGSEGGNKFGTYFQFHLELSGNILFAQRCSLHCLFFLYLLIGWCTWKLFAHVLHTKQQRK